MDIISMHGIEVYCNNRINPVGVNLNPKFSWKINKNGIQKSYQIKVLNNKNEILWDSKEVFSDESVNVYYKGKPLEGFSKYYFEITVTTDDGSVFKERGSFVTGEEDKEKWQAKWIENPDKVEAPIFYKEFTVDNITEDEYMFICGLGFFYAEINGQRVSDDLYVPVRSDYDDVSYSMLLYPYSGKTRKTAYYLSYNISKYLKIGKNDIKRCLGEGWFKQRKRTVEGIFDYGELKLLCEIHLNNKIIITDESWDTFEGKIKESNLFYGEVQDLNCSESIHKKAKLAKAVSGELLSQQCPADRVAEYINPNKVTNEIYDFGKVITGVLKIIITGEKGDVVDVFYSEEMKDGKLDFTSTLGYVENDKNQIQQDRFILSGGEEEILIPEFTWHCFRYAEIKTQAKILNVEGRFIYSDMKVTSSFKSSVEWLNTLHEICVNSIKTNVHSGIPSDCPHRERLGYTGDGQNTSYATMLNVDSQLFYEKWIKDIIDAQNEKTGFVSHTAPFNGGGGGFLWGSAIAEIPWNHYNLFGDKEILKMSKTPIEKWLGYMESRLNEEGLIDKEEDGSWCLGDWSMPTGHSWDEPHDDDIKIPSDLVNSCAFVKCIDIYEKVCAVLESKPQYPVEIIREKLKTAINKKYLSSNYVDGVQGSYVFPLYTNIVPDEKRMELVEKLIKKLEDNSYYIDTGMFATRYMFSFLSNCGRKDVVMNILKNRKCPSFRYMIDNGATSIWETWEGFGAKSHTLFSFVDEWIMNELCGIKPVKNGFKEFKIEPYFCDELDFLSGKLETVYGDISVDWKRGNDRITVNIHVPFNTFGKFSHDGKVVDLTQGNNTFEIIE